MQYTQVTWGVYVGLQTHQLYITMFPSGYGMEIYR